MMKTSKMRSIRNPSSLLKALTLTTKTPASTYYRLLPPSLSPPPPTHSRTYSTHPPNARLNIPIDFAASPILNHTPHSALSSPELPQSFHPTISSTQKTPTTRLTLHQAINSTLSHALSTDERVLVFGEDVSFGGVFRCSLNLASEYGTHRVFNTPLSEQGIIGFAIGCAAEGMKPIAEIQFADYVFPAFDQLVSEAAKYRFRAGDTDMHCGGLVVRMPTGAVGHGALYHSQSPEALFSHIPGLRVVIPRSPAQAKGLLLSAIASPDPVLFLEPKILYRAAVEHVPTPPYTLPLSKAEVLARGTDLTLISYGTMLYTAHAALAAAQRDFGISVELIDLRTIYPWDRATILDSVRKTGRAVVVHESNLNAGVGAEVAATIQDGAFERLEAPVGRVGGWATHVGLVYERFNIPDVARVYDAIKRTIEY